MCLYKIVTITRETHEANGVEVTTDRLGEFWLNERDVQEQLGLKTYLHLQTSILKHIRNKDLN